MMSNYALILLLSASPEPMKSKRKVQVFRHFQLRYQRVRSSYELRVQYHQVTLLLRHRVLLTQTT